MDISYAILGGPYPISNCHDLSQPMMIINMCWDCPHLVFVDGYGFLYHAAGLGSTPVLQLEGPCHWCLDPTLSQCGIWTRPRPQHLAASNSVAVCPSTDISDGPPINAPKGPKSDHKMVRHKPNKGFPVDDPDCHTHYDTDDCQNEWQHCGLAIAAVKASYRAKSAWKGAPAGWNDDHATCLTSEGPICDIHMHIRDEVHERRI